MNPDQATLPVVCDAAAVRKADLGQQLLLDLAAGRPTDRLVRLLVHLGLGIEQAALSADKSEQQEITAHLIENYGLLAVSTDPFLPPVRVTGAIIRPLAFTINGGIISINGKGGYAGAVLSTI